MLKVEYKGREKTNFRNKPNLYVHHLDVATDAESMTIFTENGVRIDKKVRKPVHHFYIPDVKAGAGWIVVKAGNESMEVQTE